VGDAGAPMPVQMYSKVSPGRPRDKVVAPLRVQLAVNVELALEPIVTEFGLADNAQVNEGATGATQLMVYGPAISTAAPEGGEQN
jgi:hypothetical protein